MQETKKINVAGTMKSLKVGDFFLLDRKIYKPSMVRVAASNLKIDLGIAFTTTIDDKNIKVVRIK